MDIELRENQDTPLKEYHTEMTEGEFFSWAETATTDAAIRFLIASRDERAKINKEAKQKTDPLEDKEDFVKSVFARKMLESGEDTKSVIGIGTLRLRKDISFNPDDWEKIYSVEAAHNERFTRRQLVASKVKSFLEDKNLSPEECGFSTFTKDTVIVSKPRTTK